jgi:hypothetical protein
MVLLRLIRIGERKVSQCLVKGVPIAPIATDGRIIPGLGMGTGKGPSAYFGIVFKPCGSKSIEGYRSLYGCCGGAVALFAVKILNWLVIIKYPRIMPIGNKPSPQHKLL